VTKLIIQIPCFNEAARLGETLAALPAAVAGFDRVETLVIDNGSTDETAAAARRAGATYLLRFPVHLGLARAFSDGLDAALKLGADVIVNTDGEYRGADVSQLVAPILAGRAEMVIGDRDPRLLVPVKRLLRRVGSWVVRQLSGTSVPDATSRLRAFSRRAALHLNVFTKFTYTLETIIQAGKKHIAVAHVPIQTNPERWPSRPARPFGRASVHLRQSVTTLVRIYALYEPLKVFWRLGALFAAAGLVIGLRFLVAHLGGRGAGHVQSLVLAAVLLIVGFQILLIGFVADLIGASRWLQEDTLVRLRKIELRTGNVPDVERIESPVPERHATP
jgi:glycosyltransferase involved in cell wall biosynthesis